MTAMATEPRSGVPLKPMLSRKPAPDKPKVLMRFKLLAGKHIGIDPTIPRNEGESIEDWHNRATRLYRPGDIVPSYDDLVSATAPRQEIIDRNTGESTFPIVENEAQKFERVIEGASVHDGLFHQQAGETPEQALARLQQVVTGGPAMTENASKPPVPGGTSIAEAGANVQKAAEQGFHDALSPDDVLDSMTIEELRAHATENEIDLGNASKKADILKVIKAAQA